MKRFFKILVCFVLPAFAFGQTVKTAAVPYTKGAGYTPNINTSSEIRIDTATSGLYWWDRDNLTWMRFHPGIDVIVGSGAPLYTPHDNMSLFAVNDSSEVYHFNGVEWRLISGQSVNLGNSDLVQDDPVREFRQTPDQVLGFGTFPSLPAIYGEDGRDIGYFYEPGGEGVGLINGDSTTGAVSKTRLGQTFFESYIRDSTSETHRGYIVFNANAQDSSTYFSNQLISTQSNRPEFALVAVSKRDNNLFGLFSSDGVGGELPKSLFFGEAAASNYDQYYNGDFAFGVATWSDEETPFYWTRIFVPNDTTSNSVTFYNDSYRLPNARPSATSGDTSLIAWVGDGTNAGLNPVFLPYSGGGGAADGNGIYSGSGNVPDGTVAALDDDAAISGGDISSFEILTGTTRGGRYFSNINSAILTYRDTTFNSNITVGGDGISVNLTDSGTDRFIFNDRDARYGADYSATYSDRSLVDKEYVDNAVAGVGLTDGDYGDVTVSGGGTVITIDNGVVTPSKVSSDVIVNGGNTDGGAITIGTNDNFALDFETNNIVRQSIATDGAHTFTANHTTTTTTKDVLTIRVNNNAGAGGNGYGGSILFQGESSTTDNRDMVRITGEWQSATDATRFSRCRILGVQSGGAIQEMVRFDNNAGPNMVLGNTGIVYAANSMSTASGNISITNSAAGGNITVTASGATVTNRINIGGSTTFSQTAGAKAVVEFANTFAPGSGSATFYNADFIATVNQTGGANGATGAIRFAPTLTAIGSKWSALTSATSNSNALFINQTGANSYSTHVGAFGFGSTTVPTDKVEVTGNVALLAAGNKIKIATGSNASVGTATLVAGTVTVNTTAVATGSTIFLTCNTPGGTQGFLSAPSGSIVNATSFVINSSSGTDTSTVNWWIIN